MPFWVVTDLVLVATEGLQLNILAITLSGVDNFLVCVLIACIFQCKAADNEQISRSSMLGGTS
jgi:hypothetical protein